MEACELDVIAIRNVRVYGRHGVTDAERRQAQPFDVDVWLEVDLSRAARSDRIADTLDYAGVYQSIVDAVENTSHELLERLAGEILDAVCSDRRIVQARVRVAKPGFLSGATPSVTVCRSPQ